MCVTCIVCGAQCGVCAVCVRWLVCARATCVANGVCAHLRTHKTTKANRHECVLRGGAGYRLAVYARPYLVYRWEGLWAFRTNAALSFVRYAVSQEEQELMMLPVHVAELPLRQ